MPIKTLLLDVGNTCIKYALVENLQIKVVGILKHVTDILPFISDVRICYISAVGQNERVGQILGLLENNNVDVVQLKTSAEFNGLSCVYKNPNRLGVDRWLAMLACRKKYSGNFAVLDFGTAMTCDVVNAQGQHLGGWIAPGFKTMQMALLRETERLSIENEFSQQLLLGTDTEMCINHGILASMQGFLMSADNYMLHQFQDYRIFIGGGNSQLFAEYSHGKNEMFDNLVLEGMLAFIECGHSLNN